MNLNRLFDGVLLSFVFVLVICVFVFGIQRFFDNSSEYSNQDEKTFLGSVSDSIKEVEQDNQQITDLDITAQATISVWTNLSDRKVFFSKNEDRKLTVASISKLMTVLVVLENYNLSQPIKISKEASEMGGDGELLKPEEVFLVKDLLYAAIIGSDNAAAYALSESIGIDNFIGLMNRKAKEIGLSNTSFSNTTGLALANFSTADDLVKLAEYLLKEHKTVFDISTIKEFNLYSVDGKISHKIINTDQLLKTSSDLEKRIVGGKTGETRTAGQCLLLVLGSEDNKSFLINVILNSEDRFGEMEKLINSVDKTYQWQ